MPQTLTLTFPVTVAPAAPAPEWPRPAVEFVGPDLVAYAAACPEAETADRWGVDDGGEEWRHTLTPVTAGGKAHPFLRVLIDCRRYGPPGSPAGWRYSVIVENCLNLREAGPVRYESFKMSCGPQVAIDYKREGAAKGWLHSFYTRFRQVFRVGNTPDPVYDVAAAVAALPPRLDRLPAPVFGKGPVVPLARWGQPQDNEGGPGASDHLGPVPDPCMLLPDPRAVNHCLNLGEQSGHWPFHIRTAKLPVGQDDQNDGQPVDPSKMPKFVQNWIGEQNSPAGQKPLGNFNAPTPLISDDSHFASKAYLACKLSPRDRYYSEEQQFAASYCSTRWASQADNQVRGTGWSLREVVNGYLTAPDERWKSTWAKVIDERFGDFLGKRANAPLAPVGWTLPSAAGSPDLSMYCAMWQEAYVLWAVFHARRYGIIRPGLEAAARRIAAFQLLLCTSPDWHPDYAFAGSMLIGTRSSSGAAPAYYGSLRECFAKTWGGTPQSPAKPPPTSNYYWHAARLSLLGAVEFGMPGAAAALARLESKYDPRSDGARWAITL